jgi:hypothetical protein
MTMRSVRFAAVVMLGMAVGAPAVRSQPDDQIAAARQKGIDFIKSRQKSDGTWDYENHYVGITALCTLALLENGVPVSDPVIDRGMQYVRRNLDDCTQTYDITLSLLLLHRIGDRTDRARIRDLAARLIAGQQTSGGWTYSCPKVTSIVLTNPRLLPKPGVSPGDNSNTQFGALGLWAASREGVDITDAMQKVAQRFIINQNADGGWGYRLTTETGEGANAAPQPDPSKNSMTFAGLFCLTVARATRLSERQRGEEEGVIKPGEGDLLMNDPVYARGLTRATQFMNAGGDNRYFLWSVERLGVLLGVQEFGDVNWFQRGAEALLKSQQADGSWPDAKGGLSDTAFAILFLRKANLGSDISRLLAGDPDKKFVIPTQDQEPRFDTLAEALKAAREGDTIRIDSNETHDLPHLKFDRTLTLQAGPGYRPVFQFAIGTDELGIRARPERDPDARFMLQVTKGELTLEGLKFEMDPPGGSTEIPWATLLVNGGNLRVLNCMISEQTREGSAAIRMAAPGRLVVRNSMLVGGRAAIEVVANDQQQVIVDNSLLFSDAGARVVQGPSAQQQGDVSLTFDRCTFSGQTGYDFPVLSSAVHVESNNCIYKTDWIGSSFLKTAASKEGRSWRGRQNLFDAPHWLGARGRDVPDVRDAKSWMAFWQGADTEADSRVVPFRGRKPKDAFSHTARPQDWDIEDASNLAAYRDRYGMAPLIVGPGRGYERFRESILYNEWKNGDALTSAEAP